MWWLVLMLVVLMCYEVYIVGFGDNVVGKWVYNVIICWM